MSKARTIIIGAGGLGHELAEYICDIHQIDFKEKGYIAFLDDNSDLKSENSAWPILGSLENFSPNSNDIFLIGLGSPKQRSNVQKILNSKKFKMGTLIHPKAYVSGEAEIAEGCIISPFATVGYKAILGPNVFLNTYAAVGHHVSIGSCCVLSPKALIAGRSLLKDNVFVGSGGLVTPGKKVASNSNISAGSVVYRNVKEGTTVIGNPAVNKWKKLAKK